MSLFERREEVLVRVIAGDMSVGEPEGVVRSEDAEELERVVVEERVRARRKRSLSGMMYNFAFLFMSLAACLLFVHLAVLQFVEEL